MVRKLNKSERLVCAGYAPLPAGGGMPPGTVPPGAVPHYMVVNADEADPASIVELNENERLVLAGTMLDNVKLAKERYAAYKAGKEPPPREAGISLYFIVDKKDVDDKTGLTEDENYQINEIAKFFTGEYSVHMRREKAMERYSKDHE